jgi:hypothetical protein
LFCKYNSSGFKKEVLSNFDVMLTVFVLGKNRWGEPFDVKSLFRLLVVDGDDAEAIKNAVEEKLAPFIVMVHHKYHDHKALFTFLRGMGCLQDSATHLIDVGEETAMAFKKKIAECVGLPTGKQLRLVRAAYEVSAGSVDSLDYINPIVGPLFASHLSIRTSFALLLRRSDKSEQATG